MIISISGTIGSGKSAVAKKLAEKLNLKYYSVGNLRRKRAVDRGMTIEEFNRHGEEEHFTDKEADEYQKKLGQEEDNFVIDGRLSFYFIPDSIKIYLTVNPMEGAKRIFQDPRTDEKEYKSIKEIMKANQERIESDKKRYKKYYNIDCYDLKHYDFVMDTAHISINEVVKKILLFLKKEYGKAS